MLKNKFTHKTAVFLLAALSRTWRLKLRGEMPDAPAVVIFWHGLMLPAWKLFTKMNAYGVVSKSRDGAILSELLGKMHINTIRGSAASGGSELIEDMCSLFNSENQITSKFYLLITPDGAKGPIYKIKPGAFVVSQRTGVPVYILVIKPGLSFRLNKSWDNFCIPLPFSKIELIFTEKYMPDKSFGRKEISEMIADAEILMNEQYFPKKSS